MGRKEQIGEELLYFRSLLFVLAMPNNDRLHPHTVHVHAHFAFYCASSVYIIIG